jgi:hypothetical protein
MARLSLSKPSSAEAHCTFRNRTPGCSFDARRLQGQDDLCDRVSVRRLISLRAGNGVSMDACST